MAGYHCGNHNENLVEVGVVSVAYAPADLTLLWSWSIFRSGSFYLRIVVSIKWWLLKDDNLIVIPGDPPPHTEALRAELMDFVRVNYRQFEKAYDDKDDRFPSLRV